MIIVAPRGAEEAGAWEQIVGLGSSAGEPSSLYTRCGGHGTTGTQVDPGQASPTLLSQWRAEPRVAEPVPSGAREALPP